MTGARELRAFVRSNEGEHQYGNRHREHCIRSPPRRPAGREPFKVKDLSLAEFGRKEIRLAEQEMPGLMALRAQYARQASRWPARASWAACT